jgi:hypothetical protein
MRELAARLFAPRGLHRLEAEVYGFNEAAQRVFERAGFVEEGVRRRAYDRAGRRQDGVRFGLLAEEFSRSLTRWSSRSVMPVRSSSSRSVWARSSGLGTSPESRYGSPQIE